MNVMIVNAPTANITLVTVSSFASLAVYSKSIEIVSGRTRIPTLAARSSGNSFGQGIPTEWNVSFSKL